MRQAFPGTYMKCRAEKALAGGDMTEHCPRGKTLGPMGCTIRCQATPEAHLKKVELDTGRRLPSNNLEQKRFSTGSNIPLSGNTTYVRRRLS